MAKKRKSSQPIPAPAVATANPAPATPLKRAGIIGGAFWPMALIISLAVLLFYGNTLSNEQAMDDRLVIVENDYVQAGFAGIPQILTSDAYDSYSRKQHSENQLAGGRYRPFSIVTFAIEQQFLGLQAQDTTDVSKPKGNVLTTAQLEKIKHDMHVRHVVNVLCYALAMVLLLWLLTLLFPGPGLTPLVITLLFCMMPVHSEVVANVKSRDEILSLLFICLTLIYSLRYHDTKRKLHLFVSMSSFLLALLSKEYGITLVVLLPMMLFIFRNERLQRSATAFIPYLLPLGIYAFMRLSAEKGLSGTPIDDVMNMPYLLASGTQKLASEMQVLLQYLKLVVYPAHLSSDYSYKQIPYTDFTDWKVWLSIVIYGSMLAGAVYYTRKRDYAGFALTFFLLNIFLISNIPVNVGAPMGERLEFHASLGIAMIAGYGLVWLAGKLQKPQLRTGVVAAVLMLIAVPCMNITWARNRDWKNDRTLFLKDVQTVPNSIIANVNAGASTLDIANETTDTTKQRAGYQKAITYFDKCIALDSAYMLAYTNRAVCYYKLGNADQALADLDTVRAHSPGQPSLPYMYQIVSEYFFRQGMTYGKAGQHDSAETAFAKAADAAPKDVEILYDLGFAHFSAGHYAAAIATWDKLRRMTPKDHKADAYYEQARAMVTAGRQ